MVHTPTIPRVRTMVWEGGNVFFLQICPQLLSCCLLTYCLVYCSSQIERGAGRGEREREEREEKRRRREGGEEKGRKRGKTQSRGLKRHRIKGGKDTEEREKRH